MEKILLSIEIGERLSKACILSKKGQATNVQSSISFATPDNCILDGQITQPDVLAKELMDVIKANNMFLTNNVIFVLNSPKIVSRKVSLPSNKDRQIASIVASNSSDYFPIDLTNYQISHTIIEKNPKRNGSSQVLVTALPKQLLLSYVKFAQVCSLDIQWFDVNVNAQFQLFKSLALDGVTMFVSMDTRQSNATFMEGSNLLLQRAVPFGGDEIINSVLNVANFEENMLPKALELCADDKWIVENFSKENYAGMVNRVVSAIERAADFFKTSFKSLDIKRVVLLDSCANIYGFKQAIANTLQIEVVTLNEIANINKIIVGQDITKFASSASALINPANITFAGISSGGTAAGKAKPKIKEGATSTVFLVACLAISVVVAVASVLIYVGTNTELALANARLIELQPVQQTYDVYVQYNAMADNFKVIEDTAVNNNAQIRAFLEELEEKMPTNLTVLSANCDNFGVTMNVQTASFEEAAKTIQQLRTFESITQISISSITEVENDGGTTSASFSLVCSYEPVVEEVPEQSGEEFVEGDNVDEYLEDIDNIVTGEE